MLERFACHSCHAGRIVETGHAEILYRSPTHPFVAEFLGAINKIQRTTQQQKNNTIQLGEHVIACPPHLANSNYVLSRPEDIIIDYSTNQRSNALVVRRTFLGERVQLLLTLQGSGQDTHLTACLHRDCSAQAGDAVTISVNPDRLFYAAA